MKANEIKMEKINGTNNVLLDLEHSAADEQKGEAREALKNVLKNTKSEAFTIVRINGMNTPFWDEDILAAVEGSANAILIPYCENESMVKKAAAIATYAEKRCGRKLGSTRIIADLENGPGIFNAYAICTASARVMPNGRRSRIWKRSATA